MRSDSSQPTEEFRRSPQWQFNALAGRVEPSIASRYQVGKQEIDGRLRWHSFSGSERNRLFLNVEGQRFTDISALSGLDNIADSRSFVVWDYDRDGWQDIALVNANRPLLNLYRNVMYRHGTKREAPIIAIRFVGGNDSASSSSEFGARDGYGARVFVRAGELNITREHRCGEGFAAQNSDTMIIGIGTQFQADRVSIRWPSGITQSIEDIPAGTLVDFYEDRTSSPDGRGFVLDDYRSTQFSHEPVGRRKAAPLALPLEMPELEADPAEVRLYTTMATWCEACRAHLPQIARIRAAIPRDQLGMFGLPMDGIESSQDLADYVEDNQPAYRLLTDLPSDDRLRVRQVILQALNSESLPTTIITDRTGKVIEIVAGVPTVSAVRRTMANANRVEGGAQ